MNAKAIKDKKTKTKIGKVGEHVRINLRGA